MRCSLRHLSLLLPLLIVAISCGTMGCRAPMPRWNPAVPFGPTRIPPPPTGAAKGCNTASPYYQRTRAATPPGNAAAGINASSFNTGSTQNATFANGASLYWRTNESRVPANDASLIAVRGVAPTLIQPTPSMATTQQAAIATHLSTRSPSLPAVRMAMAQTPLSKASSPYHGMRVNDATRPIEPNRFQTPNRLMEITQFPKRSAVPLRAPHNGTYQPANGTMQSAPKQPANRVAPAAAWTTGSRLDIPVGTGVKPISHSTILQSRNPPSTNYAWVDGQLVCPNGTQAWHLRSIPNDCKRY